MLSYKCNISIALWSRAENAPLTINRKTNFLVLLRSWVCWMDSTPLFCLLCPRTWTKRVGDLDYKSINFSAKVRYNHVTETDRAREGTETGADEPWKLNMQLQVLPDNDTSVKWTAEIPDRWTNPHWRPCVRSAGEPFRAQKAFSKGDVSMLNSNLNLSTLPECTFTY